MTHSSDPKAPPRAPQGRYIPREELGGFAAWAPPPLAGGRSESKPLNSADKLPEPPPALARALRAQLAAARQAGYQDGYRDGLQALEGFKQGYSVQLAGQVGQWLEAFDEQLLGLEARIAQAMADTAMVLAERVLRSELQQRPDAVVAVARQALDTLMLGARHVVVQVHPDDLPLVASGLQELLQARGARLVAHPELQRGGCVIESDLGQVDARLETRWAQAVQNLGAAHPWPEDAAPGPAPGSAP